MVKTWMRTARLRTGPDDHLADRVPAAERGHGGCRVLHGHHRRDQRVDAARRPEVDQLGVHPAGQVGRLQVVEPPVQPDDRVVLYEDVVDAELGDPAAGETDGQQATLEGDALRRPGEHLPAHRVVDDIRTLTAGRVLHGVHEVLGRVVDGQLGAQLLAHADLLRPPGGGQHPGPGGHTELDGGRADTTGAGV